MRNLWIILFIVFLNSFTAIAKVNIPTQLNAEDRTKVLDILGFGTSSRISSDNFPLGGYPGFEVGLALNFIPTSDLSNLGSTVEQQDNFQYPILSFGKGLYNNLDLFVHFMPFSEGTGLSEYGGQLRWGFYQLAYAPINFSLLLSANTVNINNQLIVKNMGYDLIMGITTHWMYFYMGAGKAESTGKFNGVGAAGITDSGIEEKDRLSSNHFMSGVGVQFDVLYINFQLDYYNYPSYTAKIGLRY